MEVEAKQTLSSQDDFGHGVNQNSRKQANTIYLKLLRCDLNLPILDSQGDFRIVLNCWCKQVTDDKRS